MRDHQVDILALIQGEDVPGDQWRIVRPFSRLQEQGISARWIGYDAPMPPTDLERSVLIVRLMTGTQDEAGIDHWLAEQRRRFRAVVYECDDLVWSEAMADHLASAAFMRGRSREALIREGELTRYFASRCDGVIVSSEPLADEMRRYTARPVIVIPNAIDTRWFRHRMLPGRPWGDALTIGWAGGRRPEADLTSMVEAWAWIADRYPDVRFVIAGAKTPDVFYREMFDLINTDRFVVVPWRKWDAYPPVYQVDIGCVAVSDTPFNQAKTPIKAWEYAVAGAVVVGTDLLYGPCLAYGGLSAHTVDEWKDSLSFLIDHEQYRRFLASRLARHVERRHALDVNAQRWTDALRMMAGQREAVTVV